MHWTLLLLLLIHAVWLSVGQVRHAYHYFEDLKTWSDAEEFCREHYTGLALVHDKNNATSVCPREQGCEGAWVRLDRGQQPGAEWRWASPNYRYDESEAAWKESRQDDAGDCAFVRFHNSSDEELSLYNQSCGTKSRFFCFSDRGSPKQYETETEMKTWCEAQKTCQKKDMDLVTGHEQIIDENFKNMTRVKGSDIAWWIGLYRSNDSLVNHFDDSLVDFCSCTKIKNDSEVEHVSDCDTLRPFICFDDHMVLVQEKKTFEEALVHCRTHYGEFATITNQHQQRMVQERVNQAQTDYTWIGLAYACFFEEWMWVTGEWVSARHQNWENPKMLHGCDIAGAMTKHEPNKWFKLSLGERFNFVCTVGCSCRGRKHG